eukprot:CAMPEP_0194519840 /NCGR_PEP_ID=MMETSP0253-20130528/53610_1 /TAXON_ID=2966 /ORGANISM="Noctiluca scintillans" /LENGTH=33 /DNA_ID= /DNA_START= /DNA_END= /DNA_ORIENTATION=
MTTPLKLKSTPNVILHAVSVEFSGSLKIKIVPT